MVYSTINIHIFINVYNSLYGDFMRRVLIFTLITLLLAGCGKQNNIGKITADNSEYKHYDISIYRSDKTGDVSPDIELISSYDLASSVIDVINQIAADKGFTKAEVNAATPMNDDEGNAKTGYVVMAGDKIFVVFYSPVYGFAYSDDFGMN